MKTLISIAVLLLFIGMVFCQPSFAGSAEIQQKLRALESAHKAGILTDEEYARKKTEFIGQQGTSAQPVLNLASYSDPGGKFQFQYPRDWVAKPFPQGQGITLEHGKAAANLMLFPGSGAKQELLAAIVEEIRGQWRDYRELRRDEKKVGGQDAQAVEITGINPKGEQSHLQIVAFVAGNTGYVFLLSAPENEFAAAKSAGEALLKSFKMGGNSVVRKDGNTYKHPIGFTFWYPKNWQCQNTQLGLQLIPPDVKSNQYGPTEGYLIIAESAQGKTRPDDPQIIQYFEMQIRTMYPYAQRVGQIESIMAGSKPGILITWEGQNPAGMQIRISVYAVLLKGYGVALVGLGDRSRMEARKSTLLAIFSSFGIGEGQKDPRVFGSWRCETYNSSGIVSDRINTVSIRYMVFRPDGTCTSGGRLLANTERRPVSGSSSFSTLDTGNSAGTQGRWGTGNNKLYIIWNDNSYSEYTYYVQGTPGSRQMLLTPGNNKKELWEEVR